MEDEVLKTDEAGQFLQLSERTVEYLVSTNQIPFSRVGKRGVRFLKSRLLEWLKEREGVEYHRSSSSDE
jgi:excisionase family DNA binding protein